ncbi:MAG: transcriptional repressor [Lachnospira sp.]|nr:transcriptional repressor [Lachnospira sp.]
METKLKRSRQRESILSFLMTRQDHPTADIIYEHVRKEIPNISLGTVYRNLALLTERGEIIKLTLDGICDRYDATTTPHFHFQCSCCKGVSDMPIPDDFTNTLNTLNNTFHGIIEGCTSYFYGICPDCKQKNQDSIHSQNLAEKNH